MDDKQHRIKVKIGDAEFEAEGSPDLVKSQFAEFMAMVSANPRAAAKESESDPQKQEQNASANENARQDDQGDLETISDALLSRIFHKSGDLISLSATPKNPVDGILMLIYGYAKLGNTQKVTGVTLMKAAKQSGLGINRVDRPLNARKDLILAGGAKRGRRYHLNNKGIQYVENLLRQME